MKKLLLVIMSLCLACSMAFAETAVELNWADVGTEDVQKLGEFQQIEIPDLPTIYFWIPSGMSSVDVSFMEGNFKPTALYSTEDQKYSVVIFVSEISSLEEYVTLMETEGGGTTFTNLTVNGVDCIGYEVPDSDLESLIYPVTENVIISFNFTPLNGDEEWDATKGVIIASIQPAE